MDFAEITTVGWLLLTVAALFVGFSKTAVTGAALVSVGLFAAVLPAKQSTGALLLLLLVGDLYAIRVYHRHANWRMLKRMAPMVLVGIVAGWIFIDLVDVTAMKRTIGAIVLLLITVHLATRDRREQLAAARQGGAAITQSAGALAGFTSMVANAGGPVMTLYMLRVGLTPLEFLGTAAWFFFVVNLTKVPFSISLGLIEPSALALAVVLIPAILAGGWIGRRLLERLQPRQFEVLVLFLAAAAAVNLLR